MKLSYLNSYRAVQFLSISPFITFANWNLLIGVDVRNYICKLKFLAQAITQDIKTCARKTKFCLTT